MTDILEKTAEFLPYSLLHQNTYIYLPENSFAPRFVQSAILGRRELDYCSILKTDRDQVCALPPLMLGYATRESRTSQLILH